MGAGVGFTRALVVSGERLYIAASPDEHEPYTPFTRLFVHDHARPERPWTKHDVEWWTVGLAMSQAADGAPMYCALSQEGDVEFIAHRKQTFEKIVDAGVWSRGNKGYGYVSDLRQIGDHLYACGSGGQVYRRDGADNWVHHDAGLLQDRKALADGAANRMLLAALDGAAEDDLYVCGSRPGETGYEGVLFHSDGTIWTPVAAPRLKQLNAIHVEGADRVWLCGIDGALLVGNHADGFEDWSDTAQGQLFHDLTMFEDTLYLASNKGLCAYDGRRRRVVRVKTGLKPEPISLMMVDHADGVLWAVGGKDIVRFDGRQWARIDHPDNPKIGRTVGDA